ncbi:response regulator [Polyangium sp. y55x31]|uniref:response regulator n=1 Tax=Polyangium sp. y55x31 TaxID=3042688 RepID=UPI0024827574|nr:response regulator [Polyangium sp. y55x31]MDI1478390.1 response regulator [Polyangium sp. y55x31]
MSHPDRPDVLPPSRPAPGEEELRRLVAHLRHELRTSLTAVIGYSEDLLDTLEGPEEILAELKALRGAGAAVLSLVNERLGADALRGLSASTLPRIVRDLGQACAEPASAISPLCARLVAAAEGAGHYALIPTLCRIQAAGVMLNDLLAGYALELLPHAPKIGGMPKAADPASEARLAETPSDERGRILLVDDNSVTRDVLRQWLVRKGHDVEEASGGDAALDLLRTREFDLVLLDLVMPDRSGIEVLDVLRAEGRLGRAPIIVLSALDEFDGVVTALERGADDYVTKPFHMVLLRARIRMALELRRHRERERAYQGMLAEIRGAR